MQSEQNSHKKIYILMPTYNGERYLSEQMDSILSQTLFSMPDWDVNVMVRDDGSSDRTVEILKKYADENPCITYSCGSNIGVIKGVFTLIENVPEDADLVALADQDDVWMDDKLEIATRLIGEVARTGNDVPILCCGMATLTDANLNPSTRMMYTDHVIPSFGNALVENICTGCTAVFNSRLVDMIKTVKPAFTVMHDWWIYMLASYYGRVVFDQKPHMLYRQHEANAVGVRSSIFSEFAGRVKRYKGNRYNISRQVKSLYDICGTQHWEQDEDKRNLLKLVLRSGICYGEDFAEKSGDIMKARMKLFFNPKIHRQRWLDNLIFKIIILGGKM